LGAYEDDDARHTVSWVFEAMEKYTQEWRGVSFNPSRHNVECYGQMEIENIPFTSAQMRTRLQMI